MCDGGGADGFAGEGGYTDSGEHATRTEKQAAGGGLAGMGRAMESGGSGSAMWLDLKKRVAGGTKILYKKYIGLDDDIEKYKCRLVAEGFCRLKGVLHGQVLTHPSGRVNPDAIGDGSY